MRPLHFNTFNRVLVELSEQGINFDEEVKGVALYLSLLTSWEVFLHDGNQQHIMTNETFSAILGEELQRRSNGHLSIDKIAEAHFTMECHREQVEIRVTEQEKETIDND